GGDTHVIAVCQPSVPVLAATALMEADKDPYAPRSIVLMGGPIDTRVNPTGVNRLAQERGVDWFRRNVITTGPFRHPGVLRRGRPLDPGKIRNTALLTVEGEHDGISGVGQTEAAHKLCVNIPADRKTHYLQLGVGHYGVFNGSRFRAEIAPRIADFMLSIDRP